MATFTIRVVLKDNAPWQDYLSLAERLAARGVVDVILSDNGTKWRMPPAEYTYTAETDSMGALNLVKSVADTLGRRYAVFVTKAQDRAWIGLDQL